jgi:Uri superfamily endonuclease
MSDTRIVAIPSVSGAYVLHLRLKESMNLTVGRLGEFLMAAGSYLYVGSAQGPGGLKARISRHMRPEKRLFWHVDFLLSTSQLLEVWFASGPKSRECKWASTFQSLPSLSIPVTGFGSSDCRCSSHLFFSSDDKPRPNPLRTLDSRIHHFAL